MCCIRVKLPGGDIGQLVGAVQHPVTNESPLLLSAPNNQVKPQVTLVLMGVVVVGTAIILSPLANMVPVVDAGTAIMGGEGDEESDG